MAPLELQLPGDLVGAIRRPTTLQDGVLRAGAVQQSSHIYMVIDTAPFASRLQLGSSLEEARSRGHRDTS